MNREQIGKFLILRELQYKEQIGKLNELGMNTLLQLQFDEDELNKKDMKEVLEFIDELEQKQNQKAIECLKEIRKKLFGTDKLDIVFDIPPIQDAMILIDTKIKDLGEKE